jgi:RHS repeat-associated protein
VGEGWNLDLGSISFSQENVTPGGTNRLENVWHINDSFGISGQLIPPDLNASTTPLVPSPLPAQYIWHTAPESHAKVQEIQGSSTPCWRVWLPGGIWEDFGCTPDSKHTYIDSHGTTIVWRWDVDLIVDSHGNQIHLTYQTHSNSDGSIRDAVLSTVEYDDPGCHNATTRCSTWNPKVIISFTASRIVPSSQLLTDAGHSTDSACLSWAGNNSYRCDDPVDHAGSGGLPVPKILNSYALLNAQVQVNGSLLREYLFKYEQSRPQDVTDPTSGKTESIAGYLDLGEIDQLGTGGSALNAPVITIDYSTEHEHYSDSALLATPTSNCSPSGWSPKNGSGQCYLWSRTYTARYISTLDNGRGWHENVNWVEGRNNTHGVDSGAINNATTCDGQETSGNRCGRADDQNWSRYAVQSRSAVSNSVTSSWSYDYYIRMNWPAPPCSDCNQGYDWGNQNDGDYADFYNGQFLSYSKVVVTAPDSSQQVHRYASSEGWGLALSTIPCAGPNPCHLAPYWDASNIEAGRDQEEDDYDTTGALLSVHQWNYADNCPPPGVPHSGHSGGSGNDPGGAQLSSELDENNPVVVCDPRVTSEDTYQVDGVTDLNGYQSDSRVVTKHTTYSHDTDDQGVPHYDYGNTNNTDVSGNDLGGGHVVTHATMYPHDDLGNNIYLVNLPALTQVRDASSPPFSAFDCEQFIYGSNSSATTAPSLPDVTQAQTYSESGCGGTLVTVKHSYDASGNAVTATDGDNHQGCPAATPTYSACAGYDSFASHLVSATNAANQTTIYSYTTTAAGGFGQWLTSETDVNGQTTSYQYDILGRLTAIVRPGDSSGSPTVSYTYVNNCSNGSTSPCLELDTATRFVVGGPTTTQKQWYDGWGHLVQTQTPSPTSGMTIVSYSLYDSMGRETTKSLPYSITTPSGYVTPDQTRARSVTSYDALGRSLGSIIYSNATTIVLESSLSYTVATGVPGTSLESSTPFERTIMLDAYTHQVIGFTDALGRTRYTQVYSGTASPYSMVRTVSTTYDPLGDPIMVQTYDSSGTLKASYSAGYDAFKRRTSFNDADLGSCSNTPLPASCSDSIDFAWKDTYDADGNLLSQIDPRNQAVYTSYDVLDRPLCRGTGSAAVNPCSNSTYAQFFYDSYDNASNPGVTFPAGCVAPTSPYTSDPVGHITAERFSSSAGSGWRCYGYDQRGQQDQSTLSVTADGTTTTQTMKMSYNDGGELTSLVYPDGETLTSQYDVNGRFQSAYFGTPSTPDPVNFLVGQSGYTGSGQLSSLAIGGSGPKSGTPTPVFTENFGYDSIQRPQSVSATVVSSTIWSQGRTYDNVGNVLQLATTVPTVGGGTQTDNQSFCYDALSRLIWAGNSGTPTGGDHCGNAPAGSTISPYQQSFSYDSLDRLTSGPAGSLTYGDSNHVHAATTLGSMPNPYASYDAMGNMTCRNTDTGGGHTCGSSPTGAQMSYDNEGHLASWTAPTGTTASDGFLYDNEGNRVLQRVSNGTIADTITFDGYTETVLSGGTTTTTKYYSVGGVRVALKTSGVVSYLLSDGLNSTTIALSSTGSTQAVQLFAPYGSVRSSQGTMPTTYNFTGERLDSQTGLLYYGSRYYDPVSGRFAQADTVQTNAGGLDSYAYVGDNPETKADPTGHMPCAGAGRCSWPSSPPSHTSGSPGHVTTSRSSVRGGASRSRGILTSRFLTNVVRTTSRYFLTSGASTLAPPTPLDTSALYRPTSCGVFITQAICGNFNVLYAIHTPWGEFAAPGTWCFECGSGGRDAKGQEESYDTGFGEGGPASDLAAVAAGECGPLSFTPETHVTTDHGQQAIGTLQVGERVLAYSPKTGKMELQPILHVWINHDRDLVDLTITTTTKGPSGKVKKTSEVVHTNQKHPFFTMEHGFLPVGQIKLGMHILRADGRVGIVTGWKVVPGARTMYNLEVAHDHTFAVGSGQWVVHNLCGPTIPDNAAKHIFSNSEGHMPDDTPGNRQLLIDTASDSSNYLGTDKYGNDWYAQNLPDGRQAWAQVRGNQIRNGGINVTPKPWDPNTGLSSPTRPTGP